MFLLNLLLALAWNLLTGEFTLTNLIAGFLIGYAILWLVGRSLGPSKYFTKAPKAISFALFFLWELFTANLRVAYDVLTFRQQARPGVLAIPLDVKSDAEAALLANLITLTPGTLSLDVSADRHVLYVHAMYVKDVEQFKRGIKEGFERRVRELLE